MNIRYIKYGRREDPRHPLDSVMMQLAVILLFVAGLSLTLFLLIVSVVVSPVAALIYWLRFRNGGQTVNIRHTENPASRNSSVIEGKYKVIDK